MPGAKLRLLHRELERRVRCQMLLHLIAAMADDDRGAGRLKRCSGAQHMVNQGQTRDAVKHFRALGLHASALARGEHDDVQIRHQASTDA